MPLAGCSGPVAVRPGGVARRGDRRRYCCSCAPLRGDTGTCQPSVPEMVRHEPISAAPRRSAAARNVVATTRRKPVRCCSRGRILRSAAFDSTGKTGNRHDSGQIYRCLINSVQDVLSILMPSVGIRHMSNAKCAFYEKICLPDYFSISRRLRRIITGSGRDCHPVEYPVRNWHGCVVVDRCSIR